MPPAKTPTKPPPDETPDPLAFSAEVHTWLDEVADKIAGFREQVGMPTLAIDAGILGHLTQIEGVVNQARMDLRTQVPPEEPAAE